jgi:hypothetical protein
MGRAHENQKKKSETNALATQKKIHTVNRRQTPIQSSTQTHMDLWISAMGDSHQFQHRNRSVFSVQYFPIHSESTLIHKQPQDP